MNTHHTTWAATAAAALTLVVGPAFAQQGTGTTTTQHQTGQTVGNGAMMQQQDGAGATGLLTGNGNGSAAPVDALFLQMAAKDNLAEIQLGQLALQKSQNAGVKRVANMIIQEHTQAQQQVQQLAQKYDVSLPAAPDAHQQAFYKHVSKLSGAQFDKMYVAQQVQSHVKDVNLFYQHPMVAAAPDVKLFAKATLPKLAGHTEMLRSVAHQVGVPETFGRPPSSTLAKLPAPAGTSTAASAAKPAAKPTSGMNGINHAGTGGMRQQP
jgi:putative membrane protein